MQTIKLSSSFLRDVFDLPKEIQKTTFDFIDKITLEHPAKIPSLNYEKMQNTTSGLSIYSARINDKYRVLIHQENNEFHLLKIGNHEPTYDSVKKINIISIMNIDNLSISKKDSSDLGKLFARISSKELEKVGIKNDKDIKVIVVQEASGNKQIFYDNNNALYNYFNIEIFGDNIQEEYEVANKINDLIGQTIYLTYKVKDQTQYWQIIFNQYTNPRAIEYYDIRRVSYTSTYQCVVNRIS